MKKRITALFLAAILLICAAGCGKAPANNNAAPAEPTDEQKQFAQFVDEQYRYSIEQDYSTAHIYYLDWEKAGLKRENIEISFGLAPDEASMKEDREYYKSLSEKLARFDRSKLTRLQQDEYDALEWEIGTVLALSDPKFDYYSQLFTPPNSLESNIVALFTSWDLRNEQDVKDVITLIDSIPAYVDSSIEYAKKQQEKNLLMTNFDDVAEGCQDIIDSGLNSYAIKCIMDQVDEADYLTADKKASYKADINAALTRSYLPSFVKIKDAFTAMKGGNNITAGLSALPNGKEYFELLLNYKLGLKGASAQDIKTKAVSWADDRYGELLDCVMKYRSDVNDYYNGKGSSGYTDYTQLLEDVKQKMLVDHPEVSDLRYKIQPASPEEKLDEKNVAAYFIIPPVDGDHMQQMRVNPSNTEIGTIDTYMTVTHEGFPGHMYQYAYAAQNIASDYIKTLGVDGVVEGYAVYSQYHALEYINSFSQGYKDFAAINEKYAYLVYSMADIGINYEGWDVKKTLTHFTDYGFGVDQAGAQQIYDLLRLNPGYYEPYGLGYEYIEEMRKGAEEALGKKFSALEFNRAILNAGPTPLKVLEHYVSDYTENAKKAK